MHSRAVSAPPLEPDAQAVEQAWLSTCSLRRSSDDDAEGTRSFPSAPGLGHPTSPVPVSLYSVKDLLMVKLSLRLSLFRGRGQRPISPAFSPVLSAVPPCPEGPRCDWPVFARVQEGQPVRHQSSIRATTHSFMSRLVSQDFEAGLRGAPREGEVSGSFGWHEPPT